MLPSLFHNMNMCSLPVACYRNHFEASVWTIPVRLTENGLFQFDLFCSFLASASSTYRNISKTISFCAIPLNKGSKRLRINGKQHGVVKIKFGSGLKKFHILRLGQHFIFYKCFWRLSHPIPERNTYEWHLIQFVPDLLFLTGNTVKHLDYCSNKNRDLVCTTNTALLRT